MKIIVIQKNYQNILKVLACQMPLIAYAEVCLLAR